MNGSSERGFTLLELLTSVTLLSVVAAIAVPPVLDGLEARRVHAAALGMRAVLQEARGFAATRATNVAVVFDPPPAPGEAPVITPPGVPVIGLYLDANRNGVRRADIRGGVEERLGNLWSFAARFPGVNWGASAEDAGGAAIPGHAVGFADMVSFSPLGTSGAGRITVSGRGVVYSIVIHGGGSRIRLERRSGARWIPI